MWAGGPPNPMQPIRPHSLAISPRLGWGALDTAATYPARREGARRSAVTKATAPDL